MTVRQRRLTGVVVSNKMEKTAVVKITRQVKHKVGKYYRLSTKIKAHDANNEARIGDTVEIVECRPISKDKSWFLDKIVTRTAEEE